MLGLPTQSGSDDGEEERRRQRQAVRWRRLQAVRSDAAATRKERRVTAEVVLGLFWSGFGNTKYMDKIQKRMYGR